MALWIVPAHTWQLRRLMVFVLVLNFLLPPLALGSTQQDGVRLFGYNERPKEGFQLFPMWARVQQQHPKDQLAERDCSHSRRLSCHLSEWQGFLATLKSQDPRAQIAAVNSYANERKYILDMDNYGVADYWATPKEFLINNGDCEDYSILKYYSLRNLGFSPETLRIVVVQDTNLRIPHAVLAVYLSSDILILDNQVPQVVSHRVAAHYVPVYSINEKQWWMHLP
jgi:predicted transglutaminase-like cysteine proteinase